MLDTRLDYHRATLLMKCAGLSEAQLKLRSAEPSTLSLLGLVRHMTEVERSWFRRTLASEDAPPLYYTRERQDDDFDAVDDADPAAMFAAFAAEVERCRANAAGAALDTVVANTSTDGRGDFSVRWIYVHMIEEYARHNGHADLLRERIDGARGD
ncbi:MAG: DinB family protein [Chloroflexota bacterium]|nr:DinB family protein [Chloroflexota bacterium]